MLVLLGQSLGVVPEFISSIVLILVFGVWLRWLPMSADWPEGTPPLAQIRYLILPSLPLVLVFFGYIARVARVGTIEALDADYTRTAILKGLSMPAVMRRHVLRNALLPTITVTASLLGYLAGGLVVIETMFHYRGIGALIYTAARAKDFPMLEAGVLTVGAVYAIASVVADLVSAALNPRLRTADERRRDAARSSTAARGRARERLGAALRSRHAARGRRRFLRSGSCVRCSARGSRRSTRTPTICLRRSRRRRRPIGSAPISWGATSSRASSSARATS